MLKKIFFLFSFLIGTNSFVSCNISDKYLNSILDECSRSYHYTTLVVYTIAKVEAYKKLEEILWTHEEEIKEKTREATPQVINKLRIDMCYYPRTQISSRKKELTKSRMLYEAVNIGFSTGILDEMDITNLGLKDTLCFWNKTYKEYSFESRPCRVG